MTEDHRFIPTDPNDIVAWLTDAYEKILKTHVYPASPERLFIQWLANALTLERALTNYAANQNLPSRAIGDNLDALAELFYAQKRPSPKPASCTVRFSISAPQNFLVLIPKGTRVTDANRSLLWETLQDAYIPVGDSFVDLKVQCTQPGKVGNDFLKGQLDSIVDPFPYFLSCVNVSDSDGGSDAPSDEEFRALLRASMDAFSCAGAKGGYIYWAKQVSTEIADVVANSPTPGVVKLYVLMNDGSPASTEIKNAVLAACSADSVRPLTDQVSVLDPEIVPYNITLTYFSPSSVNATELDSAVKKTVADFTVWQSGKLGRDINPSKLIGDLMNAGVKRVNLSEPIFAELNDGSGTQIPQLAQVSSVTITNGGAEDD